CGETHTKDDAIGSRHRLFASARHCEFTFVRTTEGAGGARAASQDSCGSTGCFGGAYCALPGSASQSDAGGVDLSTRDHAAPTVAAEEPWLEGQGTRRCGRKAAVGSQRSGYGCAAGRSEPSCQRHSMDDGSGQCLSCATERCDGRGST